MQVEELIGDLLLRHNCVVIPSFGGFVAKQTSASIDLVNGVMLPPRKSLLFNRQLINNDGLLVASLAHYAGMTFEEAQEKINTLVQEWVYRLNHGERITIERVGFLFLDQEKNIGFEQDRYFNLLLHSYGLGKVHFISEEDIQITDQPTIDSHSIQPERQLFNLESSEIELNPAGIEILPLEAATDSIRLPLADKPTIRLWKYVAAVFLIPIAFYSYWIPMKTNVLESGVFAIQDFNPFHKSAQGLYDTIAYPVGLTTKAPTKITIQSEIEKLNSSVTNWSYPFDEQLFIPVTIQQSITNPTESLQAVEPIETVVQKESVSVPKKELQKTQIKVATTSDKPAVTNSKNYYLIANCFGSETNAQNFVKLLKSNGLDAKILDVKNGLHRVSAGQSTAIETIHELQNKLKSISIDGAWILKQ